MWKDKIAEFLNRIDKLSRRRDLIDVLKIEGTSALFFDGRWRTVFCSNDYLGLRNHPRVVEAAKKAIDEWGAGAGASRLITGSLKIHSELEQKLCDWLGYESALLFGSGYLANVGAIEALGSIAKTIFSDRLNHASIIDGCRLAKCEVKIYEHLDIGALSIFLSSSQKPSMIVTESAFSMEGDCADMQKMSELASQFEALLFVDEAHAIGIYGDRGRGLCSDLRRKPDLFLGTLGKALGGYGAFIVTTKELKDFLINRARTFVFSTAPPPAAVASALAAIELIESKEAPIEKLWENTRYLRSAAGQAGLPVKPDGGPIISIIVGSEDSAVALSSYLWDRGTWVQPIRPPTVPEGASRLRITISALHAKSEIDSLIELLKERLKTAH